MPPSSQRKRKGHGETMPPLSKLDRIAELLRVQCQTFPQKDLAPEEIALWEQDLQNFPIAAIEWAFDNWRRNGRFFPVYADILDNCIAWEPPDQHRRGCSIECRERHGKGYTENDMVKLWKMYSAKISQLPDRPMNEREIDALLSELDQWRGSSPEWRRTA